MIVLDTNVVSEMMKTPINAAVQAWFDRQHAHDLFLATTSLAELQLGIALLPPGKRKTFFLATLEGFLEQVIDNRVLAFDASAALAYSQIISSARRKGRAIDVADGQIAAIAHVHGFQVATRDTEPFEAAGVGVANPWTA